MLSIIFNFLVSLVLGRSARDTEQPILKATEKLKEKNSQLQRLKESVSENEFKETVQLFYQEVTVTNQLNELRLKNNKSEADICEISLLETKKIHCNMLLLRNSRRPSPKNLKKKNLRTHFLNKLK